MRSGRALVYPVYKGTYERSVTVTGQNTFRDVAIARVKDFKRVIEYIDTRRDLDADRIGYYGVSLGAFHGILINALEPRSESDRVSRRRFGPRSLPPEIDLLNFVPRDPVADADGQRRSTIFRYPLETCPTAAVPGCCRCPPTGSATRSSTAAISRTRSTT